MFVRSRLFRPVRNLATSGSGLVLGFVWGFGEALIWPVIPDFYVFALVPASPERWWLIAASTSAGSVVGGALGFWLAFARGSTWPMDFAPLVTEGMIHQAGTWLASYGSLGVLRQPLSGIPYKVFVYLAGAGKQSFLAFFIASILARSIRIFAVAGAAALLGKLGGLQRVARYYDIFLAAFTVVFVYGLWRVVASYP